MAPSLKIVFNLEIVFKIKSYICILYYIAKKYICKVTFPKFDDFSYIIGIYKRNILIFYHFRDIIN